MKHTAAYYTLFSSCSQHQQNYLQLFWPSYLTFNSIFFQTNVLQSLSPHLTNLRNDNNIPVWPLQKIKNFHAVYSEHVVQPNIQRQFLQRPTQNYLSMCFVHNAESTLQHFLKRNLFIGPLTLIQHVPTSSRHLTVELTSTP